METKKRKKKKPKGRLAGDPIKFHTCNHVWLVPQPAGVIAMDRPNRRRERDGQQTGKQASKQASKRHKKQGFPAASGLILFVV